MVFHIADSPGQINVIIRAISVGCSNASLVIQWTVSGNGNSQITSYTLKWRRHTDGSMQNTKTLPVADHAFLTMQGGNFTLDELESGALYSVQVEAANKLTKSQSLVKNETTFGTLIYCYAVILCHVDDLYIFSGRQGSWQTECDIGNREYY